MTSQVEVRGAALRAAVLREFGRAGTVVEVRRPGEPGVLGTARTGVTFGDVPVGELILYVDSDDRLALAASNANAARKLGVEDGDILVLRRLRKRPA